MLTAENNALALRIQDGGVRAAHFACTASIHLDAQHMRYDGGARRAPPFRFSAIWLAFTRPAVRGQNRPSQACNAVVSQRLTNKLPMRRIG